jgi:hypothetical protein
VKINWQFKTRQLFAATTLVAVAVVIMCGIYAHWTSRESMAAYRPLNELLGTHKRIGWTIVDAPNDGKRYRFCGAVVHDDQEWITGSFEIADGRTKSFHVPRPEGFAIDVEGLCPEDGGELRIAVLSRPLPGSSSSTRPRIGEPSDARETSAQPVLNSHFTPRSP